MPRLIRLLLLAPLLANAAGFDPERGLFSSEPIADGLNGDSRVFCPSLRERSANRLCQLSPAIRVLQSEADAITLAENTLSLGRVPATAREALAQKIRLLRQHTIAPISALRELIQLNKARHPWYYKPVHRRN